MGFIWRKRKVGLRRELEDVKLEIPEHFLCPISLDLMKDPVTLSSGITYDRDNIEIWFESGKFTCPVSNQVLMSFDQIPNHTLRKMIQDWCVENTKFGAERIPTPRIPVTKIEVLEILRNVRNSVDRLDQFECFDLVKKIEKYGFESQRNKKCILENWTTNVLAYAFDIFAKDSYEKNGTILEEILSCLNNWMLIGFVSESHVFLGSKDSLTSMVWFLRNARHFSVRENSILVLSELISYNHRHAETLANMEGVDEIFYNLIKNPNSTTITNSSLTISFHLVCVSDKMRKSFIQTAFMPLLLELIMIDCEKSVSETALGIMDKLCDCKEGKDEAYNNVLTIPVLVKKIFRVSALASEYSISAIWKLIKTKRRIEARERILIEALEVGLFQKLLLMLQVDCRYEVKKKVAELLKLMNPYRISLGFIKTLTFNYVKIPF